MKRSKGILMADNERIAREVLAAAGGKDNIKAAYHCMSRLRLNVLDGSKVDEAAAQRIDGVLGLHKMGGQYQFIIGQNVAEVYAEFCKQAQVDRRAAIDEAPDAPVEKLTLRGVGEHVLDYLSGSIAPVIPALMVAGLFKTVQVVCGPTLLGVLSDTDGLSILLNMVFNAVFFYLPFHLGYGAAQKIGIRPVYGLILAGVLLEPNYMQLVTDGGSLVIFGIPVHMVSYAQSVMPILLCVWLTSYVEKFFNRVTPEMIKTIFVPFLTMLVMIPVSLVAVAPLGSILGEYVGQGLFALGNAGGLVSVLALGLLTAVQPLLVVTGMHTVLSTLGITVLMEHGSESFVLVANNLSNWAVWAVAFAAFVRFRQGADRENALGCFIAGFVGGITEPGLYGICLRFGRAFSGAIAGGLIAGLYCGITHVTYYVPGASSVMSVLNFVGGDGIMNAVNAAIAGILGFAVSFAVTYFFGFTKEEIEGELVK